MGNSWLTGATGALANQFSQFAAPLGPTPMQQAALRNQALQGAVGMIPPMAAMAGPPPPIPQVAVPMLGPELRAAFGPDPRAIPELPVPTFGGQGAGGFAGGIPAFPGTNFRIPERPGPTPRGGGQPGGASGNWTGGGMAGQTGYAALDQHNAELNAAMQKYGAPANLLKAMVNRESSGDWARDGSRVVDFGRRMADGTPNYILPFVGITKAAADAWGLDFYSMVGNKQAQIDGMARIMSGLANQYGGYDNAIKVYFGGEQALRGGFVDENGLDSNYYYTQAKSMWQDFDSRSGAGWNDGLPTLPKSAAGNNPWLNEALSFVGTPYVWGSIPGASQDPRVTGWDCSGMTYWMNQKYGDKSLPMGSHYQYDHFARSGRLFSDTNQLQAGDLLFWDTGNRAGGGAHLNNAGHVGIYIGNGQMLHAANPNSGTIVSSLADYMNMYGFLGAAHQSFSGGGGGFGASGLSASGYRPGAGWQSFLQNF